MIPRETPRWSQIVAVGAVWLLSPALAMAHWAFEPIAQPQPPAVADDGWVRNSIDAFILGRLEAAEIPAAAEASRAALLRRATYDLTGLPPTPADVRKFLDDDSPDAYERLVDRLLDSPHYGERWGRHWLDLVRYAETNSYERDGPKPHAWRFRDYVIRSFNDDKPYDQFVREQLAGDELPEWSPDAIVATGYYRLGLWDDEPVDALQAYFDHLDDVVTTTGQVFLAITINCARCHDHKIDPISQSDYYRFLAFFRNIQQDIRKGEFEDFAFTLNTTVPIATDEERAQQKRELAEIDVRLAGPRARLEQLNAKVLATLSNPEQDEAAAASEVRERLIREKLSAALTEREQAEWRALTEKIVQTVPNPLPMALAVKENGNQAPETFVMLRGNVHALDERVEPGFPAVFGHPDPEIPTPAADAVTSGRRAVLANWVTSDENPLTSRVIVNRIWQHHFGRGIVESSSDFGLHGTAPTHPELLDWLAREFVANGWHLKWLHRLIMTSSAYRMSTSPHAVALDRDPTNRLFSRQYMRRLDAEEVRDSLLAVSGKLNPQMFGPSFYPTVAGNILHGQSRPGDGWGESSPEEQSRRTIYAYVKRSLIVPMLEAFDVADPDTSCPARFTTTQPTQALELLNGEFAQRQSRELAGRISSEIGNDPADQVARALWLVTQREPTAHDVARGVALIEDLQENENLTADDALRTFCLLAINMNEFLYVD